MRTNRKIPQAKTHEGAPASRVSPLEQLRRAVMSCMLWEDQFYESGLDIHTRICMLSTDCSNYDLLSVAIDARHGMNLRHVSLYLLSLVALRKGGKQLEKAIYSVCQRPDDMAELVAMLWKDGKRPIPNAVKRGLARAFTKFDRYQIAKWNRDYAVKLRDVMFLVHPKPLNDEQAETFKMLADKTLTPPDTWESRLTAGGDKREVFTDLLKRNKLGYMALLRNLRGMLDAGVDENLIRRALLNLPKNNKVLPFRFLAAAKHAPRLENDIDNAMRQAMASHERLPGNTTLLVDVSGSMDYSKISAKSELTRADAAAALAILLRGICENVRVFTFSNSIVEVAPRHGMALADAIKNSQSHRGTAMGAAVQWINDNVDGDRLVVISDEQTRDRVPKPTAKRAYMLNVASYQNGVNYGAWTHINGFSEGVIRYLQELEKLDD